MKDGAKIKKGDIIEFHFNGRVLMIICKEENQPIRFENGDDSMSLGFIENPHILYDLVKLVAESHGLKVDVLGDEKKLKMGIYQYQLV